MNLLSSLYDMQLKLDNHINQTKGLEKQDLKSKKFLSFLVELGEGANEERSWKFWSNDKTRRTRKLRQPAMMSEDQEWYNPLLEEFIDGIHFLLSIGNDFGYSKDAGIIEFYLHELNLLHYQERDITEQYLTVFVKFADFINVPAMIKYIDLFIAYIALGKMLGFNWEQIKTSYMEKNAINHLRQNNGY